MLSEVGKSKSEIPNNFVKDLFNLGHVFVKIGK